MMLELRAARSLEELLRGGPRHADAEARLAQIHGSLPERSDTRAANTV
jgi:hypothetical protein